MNPTPTPTRTEERRHRRWWLLPLLFPVAAVVLFGFLLWHERYQADKAWAEATAEAETLEPKWRWEDLKAQWPAPRPDRNAALVIAAAADKLPKGWPDWRTVVRDEDLPPPPQEAPADAIPPGLPAVLAGNVPVQRDQQAQAAQQLEESMGKLRPNELFYPNQLRAVRAILPAEALAEARRLPKFRGGRLPWPTQRPLLSHLNFDSIQSLRQVANLLRLHAQLAAAEGRADDAVDDCCGILIVARTSADTPIFINGLVAMAIRAIAVVQIERVLGLTEPTPDALRRLQDILDEDLAHPLMADALRGERALIDDLVRAIGEGLIAPPDVAELDLAAVPGVTGWSTLDRWIHKMRGGGWSKRYAADMVRFYTLLIAQLNVSPDEPLRRAGDLGPFRANMSPTAFRWTAGTDKMIEGDRRMRAHLAAAATAVAAERFRRDRGRWPESLAELVPSYVTAVPTDPFDLQPLRYRRLPDGITVYSVGQDGTDDDGTTHLDAGQFGVAKDLGIRLWDVPQRRRPPAPKDAANEGRP